MKGVRFLTRGEPGQTDDILSETSSACGTRPIVWSRQRSRAARTPNAARTPQSVLFIDELDVDVCAPRTMSRRVRTATFGSEKDLVDQTSTSWNQIASWLKRFDGLRVAA